MNHQMERASREHDWQLLLDEGKQDRYLNHTVVDRLFALLRERNIELPTQYSTGGSPLLYLCAQIQMNEADFMALVEQAERSSCSERKSTMSQVQPVFFARLVDESGELGSISLSPEQVDALKTRGIIRLCGHCSQTSRLSDAVIEYHLAATHTYRCVEQSGVSDPDLAYMADGDDLCQLCTGDVKQTPVDGTEEREFPAPENLPEGWGDDYCTSASVEPNGEYEAWLGWKNAPRAEEY